MGLMSREKGKSYERKVADMLRKRWPAVIVRRASQAERADNPDVFVEGNWVLAKLWLECQDARKPTPRDKLRQAEVDVLSWQHRRGLPVDRVRSRWPVVIWHRLGERTSYATMRVNTLLDIVQPIPDAESELREVVTVELDAFLRMLEVV